MKFGMEELTEGQMQHVAPMQQKTLKSPLE